MMVLGHRGAAGPGAPENTLVAVDRALRAGADGVEVDVRLTADGTAVCHHDPGLRRTAGDPRQLSAVPSAQLPTVQGHPIPTLAEVLDLVGRRGRLVVEVKTADWPTAIVDVVAAELRRHHLHDVVVSSFDRPAVGRVRALDLPVRTALLGRPGMPLGVVLRRALRDGHHEAHPHVLTTLRRLDLVRPAAREGIGVTAWTVDRGDDLLRLADAGVQAAIADDPAWACEVLAGAPLRQVG